MKTMIALFLYLSISFVATAQNNSLQTISLFVDADSSITVTKDIDREYWGTYIFEDDSPEYRWEAYLSLTQSYYWKTTKDVSGNLTTYNWEEDDKEQIEWGALVENGKIKTTTVKDFRKGQPNIEAMIIVMRNKLTGEIRTLNLYMKRGKPHLADAPKLTLEENEPGYSSRD